jgi:hypothetical protein
MKTIKRRWKMIIYVKLYYIHISSGDKVSKFFVFLVYYSNMFKFKKEGNVKNDGKTKVFLYRWLEKI